MIASVIDQGVHVAAQKLVSAWGSIRPRDVFRSPMRSALSQIAWHVHHESGTAPSLLDNRPLANTVRRLAGDHLHRNIRSGQLDALAVVASSCSKSQAVVFVDKIGPPVASDGDPCAPLVYRPVKLELTHLLASAAFPCAFPPKCIEDDWYVDGGVHLNTPLKPAIDLGADRLLVVGGTPLAERCLAPARQPPDVADGGAQVLHALLTDRMRADLTTLAWTNGHVRTLEAAARQAQHRLLHTFVVNPSNDHLSRLAAELWTPNWKHLLSSLGGDRLLGALLRQRQHPGRFLSYLCFDPGFIEGAIAQGQEDATAALGPASSIPWHIP
jgi:NTE family protein